MHAQIDPMRKWWRFLWMPNHSSEGRIGFDLWWTDEGEVVLDVWARGHQLRFLVWRGTYR